MPEKKTKADKPYRIDGKKFVWTTDEGDTVTIPLRIKLKLIRSMAGRDLDAASMFDMLEALIPGQADTLDEMDVNDFQAMFKAWQTEYNALTGATLGESSGSSD